MRILGIDPGLSITGYGVVDGLPRPTAVRFGGLRTPAGVPEAVRLRMLYEAVSGIIRELSPDVLAIEELFFNKNARSAMAVGQARGVILLAAAEAGLEVREFTPLEVKLAVTGQGRAAKEQVGYMVKALLALDEVPRPDDVTDALAVALTCAQTMQTKRRWGACELD
ncbi:MAG: crossover junction endodeoxyribonuclease RuvC [Limnochordales bacterium]|nr:crossover junction endodeoxyribonuclease RuvC [Bacillota bacterium]